MSTAPRSWRSADGPTVNSLRHSIWYAQPQFSSRLLGDRLLYGRRFAAAYHELAQQDVRRHKAVLQSGEARAATAGCCCGPRCAPTAAKKRAGLGRPCDETAAQGSLGGSGTPEPPFAPAAARLPWLVAGGNEAAHGTRRGRYTSTFAACSVLTRMLCGCFSACSMRRGSGPRLSW